MRRVLSFLAVCGLLLGLCGCQPAATTAAVSLRINEAQSSGGQTDWVELYNAADTDCDLSGLFFSDDPDRLGKYEFQGVSIPAHGYLLLLADGSRVKQDEAGYHLPFSLNAAGETLYLSRHDGTPIDTLTLPAGVPGLSYGCDESADEPGDTYVWYAAPTPGASNQNGMMLGKETFLPENGILISEYQSRNRSTLYDESGDYPDWVELYNLTGQAIDLYGYTLTDDRGKVAKWAFPDHIALPAHGYRVIFCSGKDTVTAHKECHTSFSLGGEDAFLALYTPDGKLCSGVSYSATDTDRSCSYIEDRGYVKNTAPTPGGTNVITGGDGI